MTDTDSANLEESYQSMYGIPTNVTRCSSVDHQEGELSLYKRTSALTTIPCIIDELSSFFNCHPIHECSLWSDTKDRLTDLMHRVCLSDGEISKYVHYDACLPYTRNLIGSDRTNYSLILLCWGAGRESKIHDHPSRGCFLKVLRGCIQESIYEVHPERDEIRLRDESVHTEGSVAFMSDDIGLHKISNPSTNQPAISLHLYVPPFQKCKIWLDDTNSYSAFKEGVVGYYSEYGIEGPGAGSVKDSDSLMYYI